MKVKDFKIFLDAHPDDMQVFAVAECATFDIEECLVVANGELIIDLDGFIVNAEH